MGGGGAAAAAAQAAMIQAVKASGAIVQVAPRDFQELLRRQHGGWSSTPPGAGARQLPVPDELQRVGFLHQVAHRTRPAARDRGGQGREDLGAVVAATGRQEPAGRLRIREASRTLSGTHAVAPDEDSSPMPSRRSRC